MSGCCRAGPCEQMFGPRVARWDLRRYRSHGVGAVERRMLRAARGAPLDGARVLEIGGGIGALQAELLLTGAQSGEVVELAEAYRPYAAQLAESAGLAGRTSFRVVDLLGEPGQVAPADVVLLNRVVCCTPDGPELTAAAARLTRRMLLLSFPRDRWWTRAASASQNAAFGLLRRSFRSYVRPASAIVAAAEAEGLSVSSRGAGRVWEFVALTPRQK